MVRMLTTALITLVTISAGSAQAEEHGYPLYQPRDGERIAFDVFRGASEFGVHEVGFRRDGGDVIADVFIRLRAGLGPITVFRYEHESSERWRDGQLLGKTARTLKDGEEFRIETRLEDGAIVTSGTAEGGRQIAESLASTILPSSHWHGYPDGLTVMLNTETGEPMDIQLTYVGRERIEADGGVIEADRYRLESSITLDLWYDANGRWAGCAFEARGQEIRYIRRADPLQG
ncbi:MAG: DUF6134 family protein [Pseudomonadota bacterium]